MRKEYYLVDVQNTITSLELFSTLENMEPQEHHAVHIE